LNAGSAAVRLSSGAEIEASYPPGIEPAAKVTVAVRPEHARIVTANPAAALSATVANSVYLGTDTHVHLQLADGTPFMVRQQNVGAAGGPAEPGALVGIAISPGLARIVKD
jgi:spermidine/putrescine transport system ATP-binding protein